jgi:3-deoxy-D-manno-octulosonic acid kinase
MQYLTKQRYLKLGETRCQREFELLQTVRDFGINAPEPIAYAYRGWPFYLAWLVTRRIQQPLSLAELATQDHKQTQKVMKSVIEQVVLLIERGIVHCDLHPGNVAVDSQKKVFLVDFDKGYLITGNKDKLRKRYASRWQRAVKKHNLPSMLSETMVVGLSVNAENLKAV